MAKRARKTEWIRHAVAHYETRLVRYAARITGDLERARDVVQETFLRLCRRERSQVEPHLAEWLFTVCRNRAFDVRRENRKMRSITEAEMEFGQSCDPAPEVVCERRDEARRVLEALAELPQSQQEVIRLKLQEGLTYREISRITKLTVNNAAYLIHRGLGSIRRRLAVEADAAEA